MRPKLHYNSPGMCNFENANFMKNLRFVFLHIILVLCCCLSLQAQKTVVSQKPVNTQNTVSKQNTVSTPHSVNTHQLNNTDKRVIVWTGIKKTFANETDSISYLSFNGAGYKKNIPYYNEKIKVADNYTYTVALKNEVFAECTSTEAALIPVKEIKSEVVVNSNVAKAKKIPFLCISFMPLRKNSTTGRIEKLVSFNFDIVQGQHTAKSNIQRTYAASSVLATGKWYKIGVSDDGVYKLTYNDLVNLGMDMSNVNPKNIRIYGNGGGMLPEDNFVARYDDLGRKSYLCIRRYQ